MLFYVIIGVILGVVVELGARLLRLWVYHWSLTPLLNVLLVFGVIMGGLASRMRPLGLPVVVGSAFAVGLLYEILNLSVLKWRSFPGERLGFIRGHAAIVLVMAAVWAVVPVVIADAHAVLPRGLRAFGSGMSRLERLNERERLLMQKLDALQERTRAVETQLEELRAVKQALLNRQGVRRLRPQDAPSPTP